MKIGIGLVGTNGAGKSTACELLEEEGFRKISLSDFLREIVKEQGLPLDRDTLTNESNKIKHQFGNDYFAKVAISYAKNNHIEKAIFDSVRHPDEVLYLKTNGVIFIGIDAPIELRYERITSRMKETDKVNFETFLRQDNYERFGASSGQNIEMALKECSTILTNTGSKESLKQELHTAIGDTLNATLNH